MLIQQCNVDTTKNVVLLELSVTVSYLIYLVCSTQGYNFPSLTLTTTFQSHYSQHMALHHIDYFS